MNGEDLPWTPRSEQNRTVLNLLENLSQFWLGEVDTTHKVTDNIFNEAGLLKLNCDKALAYLSWQATLEFDETIKFTSEWYYNFYHSTINILDLQWNKFDYMKSMLKNKIL